MEVKFKVWNKKDKQMIDWFTLTQNAWNTFRGETPLSLIYDVLVARKDDFDKLLFTGYLYKNNKEIYEGDIFISKRNILYTVKFIDGGFIGAGINSHFEIRIYKLIEEGKYLGNIYENPELLGVS